MTGYLAAKLAIVESDKAFYYFAEFDQVLGNKDLRSPFKPNFDDLMEEDNWFTEFLASEFHRSKVARGNQHRRGRKSNDRDIQRYVSAVTFCELCKLLYHETTQPMEIVNEILLLAFDIVNPILKHQVFDIFYSHIRAIDEEQTELIEGELDRTMEQVLTGTKTPLDICALLTITHFDAVITHDIETRISLDQIFERLERGRNSDSIESQQAACHALLALADRYPLISASIYEFARKSRWSNTPDIGYIFHFNATAFDHFFSFYDQSKVILTSKSGLSLPNGLLLSTMYLMALSLSVSTFTERFDDREKNMITNNPINANDCVILLEKCGSVLSKKAASVVNRLLANSASTESDLLVIERALRACKSSDGFASDFMDKWLNYSEKKCSVRCRFAYHAALNRVSQIVQDSFALQICLRLLMNDCDYFRARAECNLETDLKLDMLTSVEKPIEILQMLVQFGYQSARTLEKINRIRVKIYEIQHLDHILKLERRRIQSNSTLDTKQIDHTLFNQYFSLFVFDIRMETPMVMKRFTKHVCQRFNQIIDSTNISQQKYVIELLFFLGRNWRDQDYYVDLTQNECLIDCCSQMLMCLINKNQNMGIIKAAVFALGCSELQAATDFLERLILTAANANAELPFCDEILVAIIDSYCQGSRMRVHSQMENSFRKLMLNSSAAIARAAATGLVALKWYYNPSASCDDMLKLFHRQYLQLYLSLMDAADDMRAPDHAYDVTAELIITNAETLLPKFVHDMYANIAHFRADILDGPDKDQYFYPTHLRVAVRIATKMLIAFQWAIEQNLPAGTELFKQALFAMSKQLDKNRRIASIQLLSMYGNLTNNLVEMFLCAAWEQPESIQLLAYENIARVERVDSRDIVETLIEITRHDGSLQRRYVAAMLLVQLARCDQVSVREVQRVLSDVTNDQSVEFDDVSVPLIFGRDVTNGQDRFDRAVLSLLMQLSFVLDKEKQSSNIKFSLPAENFDLDRENKYAIHGAEYACCVCELYPNK